MKLRKLGDWKRARKVLDELPRKSRKAQKAAVTSEARRGLRAVQRGLKQGAPGGTQLRPLAGGKQRKPLVDSGELAASVKVIIRGDTAFVGVPAGARSSSGQLLAERAAIHEFGAGPIVIPITPAMRAFLHATMPKTGPRQGRGDGVVVTQIPARPFLEPAFKAAIQGADKRALASLRRALGV